MKHKEFKIDIADIKDDNEKSIYDIPNDGREEISIEPLDLDYM